MVLAGHRILRCPRKWKLRAICLPRAHLASLPHSRGRCGLLPGLSGPGCAVRAGYPPSGGFVLRKHIAAAIVAATALLGSAIAGSATAGADTSVTPQAVTAVP